MINVLKWGILLGLMMGFIIFNGYFGAHIYPRLEDRFFGGYLSRKLGVKLQPHPDPTIRKWVAAEDAELTPSASRTLSRWNTLFPVIGTLPIWGVLALMFGVVWVVSRLI